jgi:plastocyanin
MHPSPPSVHRRRVAAVPFLAWLLVVVSPTGALATEPVPPDMTVEVRSISYAPRDITVPRGTLVVWDNVTSPDRVHDVVSSVPGLFESGRFHAGETYAHRFTAAGTFTLHLLHP